MLVLKLRLWLAKRTAIFLTRWNLCHGWRIRLIHKIHNLHNRIHREGKTCPPKI